MHLLKLLGAGGVAADLVLLDRSGAGRGERNSSNRRGWTDGTFEWLAARSICIDPAPIQPKPTL